MWVVNSASHGEEGRWGPFVEVLGGNIWRHKKGLPGYNGVLFSKLNLMGKQTLCPVLITEVHDTRQMLGSGRKVSLGRSLVDEVGNQVSCQSVVLSC
jgi:hypothetical protein